VEACAEKLAGTDPLKITGETARLVEDEQEYRRTSRIHNPDGDGRASERITGAIAAYFGVNTETLVRSQ